MEILILQIKKTEDGYLFLPTLLDAPVVITLPERVDCILIIHEDNVIRILATEAACI